MTVLVLNCGSSSVKWQLLDPGTGTGAGRIGKGQVERIGVEGSDVADHGAALRRVAEEVDAALAGRELAAVGHRVVHGGDEYTAPVVVDERVLAAIDRLGVLAPLHNPVNAQGIRAAQESFGGVPHVAVFDTAFHATIPAAHRSYAVPREWEREHGVRRYGFHGTSVAYVQRRAGDWLAEHRGVDPAASRLVVLHLGNGASATAVLGGRSVDTSMGFTPLPGLVMGTRSGDVDPAVFAHLARVAGMDAAEVESALMRRSGLAGLCGDSDMRQVGERAAGGDEQARHALDVYAHRVRHYLGAYAVVLGGLDAVVFTAGVGENSPPVRELIMRGLEPVGLVLDADRNGAAGDGIRPVTTDGSPVTALVVPTDEEWEIARQTLAATGG